MTIYQRSFCSLLLLLHGSSIRYTHASTYRFPRSQVVAWILEAGSVVTPLAPPLFVAKVRLL